MYYIHMWTLVALIITPFLLGILCGIGIYEKKIVLKRIQEIPPNKLKDLLDNYEN